MDAVLQNIPGALAHKLIFFEVVYLLLVVVLKFLDPLRFLGQKLVLFI